MRKINMSGLRFGRLTVLCEDGRLNGEVSWKCKCDCGNIKIVRGSHLRKGSIMSCGCLLSDTLKERNTIHNMTNTKIYKIWMHLKGMCYTKTDFNYHKVGAAGILMDESWIDKQMGLLNFYSWAKSVGYEDGMEICRKDDSKNYCPENCYFKKNNYKKYEYPNIETKLDKTIKRINESQKFDSVFKIDFDEFFERHTRMELAHIAHEIINYLEEPDEHKTD